MPALRTAMRASAMASARSGARSASTSVVLSTFSRMSEIAFWFLSLSNSVSRSVSRWMRSISSGALLSRAPSPPELAGMHRAALRADLGDRRRALDRAVELDFADAGEADALDLRAWCPGAPGSASSTSIRTHTNSGRLGSSEILLDLADRNAREGHVRALVEPADAPARNRCRSIWSACSTGPASQTMNSSTPTSSASVTAPTIT